MGSGGVTGDADSLFPDMGLGPLLIVSVGIGASAVDGFSSAIAADPPPDTGIGIGDAAFATWTIGIGALDGITVIGGAAGGVAAGGGGAAFATGGGVSTGPGRGAARAAAEATAVLDELLPGVKTITSTCPLLVFTTKLWPSSRRATTRRSDPS